MLNKVKLNNLTLLFFYSIPIITVIFFISLFGVDIPFWDEWELVTLFDKIFSNTLSFQDLFIQHNEHRIIIPKLIFIALILINGWNTKQLMFISVLLVITSFIFCCKINYLVFNNENKKQHLINLLIGFLVFSLGQWENWLWGFQIAWFLINLCFIISIYFLIKVNKENLYRYLFYSAFFCFIASFSSAHGLLIWLAVIPLILGLKINVNSKIKIIIFWVSSFLICTSIYLIDYHKPSHHPNILFNAENVFTRIKYFFVLIGSFAPTIKSRAIIGFFSFIILITFYFYCYLKGLTKVKKYYLLPLSFSLYSVLFALITTLGRAGFGVGQATSSRYLTPMIWLYISLIYIGYFLLNKKSDLKNSY